jgi:hypothetical protein
MPRRRSRTIGPPWKAWTRCARTVCSPCVHRGIAGVPGRARRPSPAPGRHCPILSVYGLDRRDKRDRKNFAVRAFQDSLPDVFADPDALGCGSGSPHGQGERVPEGVRISGRWPNASGCEDAAWAVLGLMADGQYSLAVVPRTDLAVDRTWHMAGMRATGSHTLVAEDLVVPAERVAAASMPPIEDAMLYAGDTATVMNGEERAFLSAATVSYWIEVDAVTTRQQRRRHRSPGPFLDRCYWGVEGPRHLCVASSDQQVETDSSLAASGDDENASVVVCSRPRRAAGQQLVPRRHAFAGGRVPIRDRGPRDVRRRCTRSRLRSREVLAFDGGAWGKGSCRPSDTNACSIRG